MRQHNTLEEKQKRVECYHKLRLAGVPPVHARRIKDWTDNKIELVCSGIAKPF